MISERHNGSGKAIEMGSTWTRWISRTRLLQCLLSLGILLSPLISSPGARAFPGEITEFPLPVAESWPDGITAGPEGNLWFTEWKTNGIGRITSTGKITEYPLPKGSGRPTSITEGIDGNLWFTEETGEDGIGRITPGGQITGFAIPRQEQPRSITMGPDGNLWFTEQSDHVGNKIGRITPGGQISEFPLPSAEGAPGGITLGPEGNLWFTEANSVHPLDGPFMIGRITPGGVITEFPVPDLSGEIGEPLAITAGPNGNLWFTMLGGGITDSAIGRISPNGQVTEFPSVDRESNPYAITRGPDGNLWFDGNKEGRTSTHEAGYDHGPPEIGRVTPPSGYVTEFIAASVLGGSSEGPPFGGGITPGPEGNIWFTEPHEDKIGRIAPGPSPPLAIEIASGHALVHHHQAILSLTCGGGPSGSVCSGMVRLRIWNGKIVLGHRSYTIPSEAEQQIALPLNRRALALLARDHQMTVKTTASVSGGKGESGEVTLVRGSGRMTH